MTENLGDFFKSISRVKMDLDTFVDFLERLRKDELTVERVEDRRWKAKWGTCEGCWIVALPIAERELTVDFFLFSWDQDTLAAFRWPEVQGKYYKVLDFDKPPTLEQVTNLWPQRVFGTIEAGLQELGVLQGETPAKDGAGNGETLKEPELTTAPPNDWFDWYHSCKNQGRRITLQELAGKMGLSYDYVRHLHQKYKAKHDITQK